MSTEISLPPNFIRDIIDRDLASGKHRGVVTRFPPEPNGYLHIGHAKSICLNFGLALETGGRCHMRFDDTNPLKESTEFVESILNDVRWLGFDWEEHLYYASDYFEQLFNYAVDLIKKDKAYVCSLSSEEIRRTRGTLTEPGNDSPYRNRPIAESLDLFTRMRAGEFKDEEHVVRAKIDMRSPNINMRDPVIFRIRHAEHHRTGDKWCIYPMYDYTHCISDALERITHSICTLEFEDHRPLYDWCLEQLDVPCHPQQIEFARLNLTYTVLSKRRLLELVNGKYVAGWDDPRMPTLAGLRRRGYTPQALRSFCEKIGVAKAESIVDLALLEFCLREDLNSRALRAMAVLQPLKLIIIDYPEGKEENLEAENNPEDPQAGKRQIPFCRELFIEREDFEENPPKGFFRLAPGMEVRLKHAYYVKCVNVVKNQSGEITEVHCTHDPETHGGWSSDGRKVKGTLHWVSARHAVAGEVRLYDNLFSKPNPDEVEEGKNYLSNINPNSLVVLRDCKLEPALAQAQVGTSYQFLRLGYFCPDAKDFNAQTGSLVFNRTVQLKDSWSKEKQKKQA